MDDILARLARLESDQTALRRGVSILDAEAVRSRRESTAAQDAALVARLSPGSLGTPVGARGALFDSLPALGAPLLQRLRDDASLSSQAPGRPEGGYPNLLSDPLLDTFTSPGLLTTSYADHGTEWEAKYVLNSGTAPAARAFAVSPRGVLGPGMYGFEHTAMVALELVFAATGNITVYLRAKDGHTPDAAYLPSWITGSAVIFSGGAPTSATATLEIVDSVDTVLSAGDPVDIVEIGELAEVAMVEAAVQGPAAATLYRWRLRIDVSGINGDSLSTGIVDPLFAVSDDGTPPAFSPALGPWLPGVPGYQLSDRVYVQNNIPAGTTAYMPVGDITMPATLPERWAGSVVGVSYRMDGVLTAGTMSIKIHKNGARVWTAFSLNTASPQEAYVSVAPGTYTFAAGDDIQVELSTGGGFTPTTRDIVVEVSRLLTYTGG